MIYARFRAEPSGDTPVTITMTCSLSDWKYALEQMRDIDNYETSQIKGVLEVAINQVCATYGVETEKKL